MTAHSFKRVSPSKEAFVEMLLNHVKLSRKEQRELNREIIEMIEDANIFDKQRNFFFLTDFYKQTHWMQDPAGTTEKYAYYENRSSIFPKQIFFGLSYIIQKYLTGKVARQWMVDQAEARVKAESGGFDYFNVIGAQRIIDKHDGRLPLEIKAVDEGALVGTGNVLFTVRNTDPELPFLTNYVEDILMHVYSTIGTATLSFYIRKLAEKWANITGAVIHPSYLNDFGLRGGSSLETSEKNGGAHLLIFSGSDNEAAQSWLEDYYDAPLVLSSVFATEHSTTTIWTRNGELNAVRAWLERAPDEAILSFVIDSYDYEKFITDILGNPEIKAKILSRKGKVVARPDSGIPNIVAKRCLDLLSATFGFTINEKGYKVLDPHVGVIYGDGINYDSINLILKTIVEGGFCVSNIVFGMGGALIQGINRDTNGVAIKCSHAIVNGEGVDVFKDPKGGSKKSKKGYLILHPHNPFTGSYTTFSSSDNTEAAFSSYHDALKRVFLNGEQFNKPTYAEIKERIEGLIKTAPAEFYGTELEHL